MVAGVGERKRERAVGSTFLREPLRQRKRLSEAVVEATETRSELLVVYGFGTRGQCSRELERWSDHHEQHGEIESATARLLFLRLIHSLTLLNYERF